MDNKKIMKFIKFLLFLIVIIIISSIVKNIYFKDNFVNFSKSYDILDHKTKNTLSIINTKPEEFIQSPEWYCTTDTAMWDYPNLGFDDAYVEIMKDYEYNVMVHANHYVLGEEIKKYRKKKSLQATFATVYGTVGSGAVLLKDDSIYYGSVIIEETVDFGKSAKVQNYKFYAKWLRSIKNNVLYTTICMSTKDFDITKGKCALEAKEKQGIVLDKKDIATLSYNFQPYSQVINLE